MRKLIFLFFSLVIACSFSGKVVAQDKPTVEIVSLKHDGKNVDFNLSSSKPFIFGNNRYILYIGDKEFFLNKQSHDDGKGSMTFFIPKAEFNELKEGAAVYLTYGHIFRDGDQNMEEKARQNRRAWTLGKFNKTLLTK